MKNIGNFTLPSLFILFCFAATMSTSAQNYSNPDSLIQTIPDSVTKSVVPFSKYLKQNFGSDEEITKVLYIWLAKTMYYDLDMLEMPGKYENTEQIILQTLQTRKGVCQNYAEVFTGVLREAGIPTFTIHGYVKNEGKVETEIGHAWNAAKVNEKWYLFDPTYGGGYIRYERFHRRFTMDYFMVNPDTLLKNHMPFDPIWQLVETPIKHDQFFEGQANQGEKLYCIDSLNAYLSQSIYFQAQGSMNRSLLYNVSLPALSKLKEHEFDYLIGLQRNSCIDCYNQLVTQLNIFLNSKGNNPDKAKAKASLNSLFKSTQLCKEQTQEIVNADTIFRPIGQTLLTNISDIEHNIIYLSGK